MVVVHDLTGKRVLVVGGARALGRAIVEASLNAGASVIIGARDKDAAKVAAERYEGADSVFIDILDEESIADAAAALGEVDHVVSVANAAHNVPLAATDRDLTLRALEAKVVGPLLIAKHFSPSMPADGSFVFFSGVVAWTPSPGRVVTGVTNGAVSFLASHLARELAPIRVNAVSPGITDSGTWDSLPAEEKTALLAGAAAGALVGRAGTTEDIVDAVLWLLGAGYVSGETIHVEGGARFR